MGILKFLVWTGTCVAIGVWLGGFEFQGHTPVEHFERAWKSGSPKLEKVRDGAGDLVEEVKKKVSTKDGRPTEHHTTEDRDAIEKLIAKRAK